MLKDVIATVEFHLDGYSQLPLYNSAETTPIMLEEKFPSTGTTSTMAEGKFPSIGGVSGDEVARRGGYTKHQEIPNIHTISTSARSFFEITSNNMDTGSAGAQTEDTRTWEELEYEASQCHKCRLCEKRKNVVFGTGNKNNPKIVFVGEGPGADEDEQGEPFVGRAGKLLTSAIENGLKLKRNDVYICNVVKCRPPENRVPMDDEVKACTPYLHRQLMLAKPEVIITLGQPAQKALSGIDMGITKLRGQWQNWHGIKLMPTFHPAYILRNPPAKRPFWEDLQAVMREIGIGG